MFKKILKGLAIVLGIGALVDLTDICGKAAAYHAMSLHNKEAVDDLLEYLENDENLEEEGLSKAKQYRVGMVTKCTRFFMENR